MRRRIRDENLLQTLAFSKAEKRPVSQNPKGHIDCKPYTINMPFNFKKANRYSYLSDSIGSRRAAFLAGHKPNIKPMPHDTVSPAIGAQVGT